MVKEADSKTEKLPLGEEEGRCGYWKDDHIDHSFLVAKTQRETHQGLEPSFSNWISTKFVKCQIGNIWGCLVSVMTLAVLHKRGFRQYLKTSMAVSQSNSICKATLPGFGPKGLRLLTFELSKSKYSCY